MDRREGGDGFDFHSRFVLRDSICLGSVGNRQGLVDHRNRDLAVFGSVARGDDRPDSDIDVAVEIEAGRSFSLIRMEETRLLLEDALRRPVDLGEIASFRPQVRAAFDLEQVPIF